MHIAETKAGLIKLPPTSWGISFCWGCRTGDIKETLLLGPNSHLRPIWTPKVAHIIEFSLAEWWRRETNCEDSFRANILQYEDITPTFSLLLKDCHGSHDSRGLCDQVKLNPY